MALLPRKEHSSRVLNRDKCKPTERDVTRHTCPAYNDKAFQHERADNKARRQSLPTPDPLNKPKKTPTLQYWLLFSHRAFENLRILVQLAQIITGYLQQVVYIRVVVKPYCCMRTAGRRVQGCQTSTAASCVRPSGGSRYFACSTIELHILRKTLSAASWLGYMLM